MTLPVVLLFEKKKRKEKKRKVWLIYLFYLFLHELKLDNKTKAAAK